eukprot:6174076-Pleurochrysis_carterae.AAC.1
MLLSANVDAIQCVRAALKSLFFFRSCSDVYVLFTIICCRDKVFAALAAFDFGDGAVLTPAPLPPPDVDAVKELFGSNSLATTSIASP